MQIRENRCNEFFCATNRAKVFRILDKLKTSQIQEGCASQERVAEIKSGAIYCAAMVKLEASVVREVRM